jgi:hypothetical protein
MCVTDLWVHIRFMHLILSLKLGVTVVKDDQQGGEIIEKRGENEGCL